MKKLLSASGLACLVAAICLSTWSAAVGRNPEPLRAPTVITRLHHLGADQLSRDTNGSVFKEIWGLPASAQFRDETLDKLAAGLAANFQAKGHAGGHGSAARVMRPLLNDLCTSETLLEIIEHPQGKLETTLAARLDENRARAWQSALEQLKAGWQPQNGVLAFSVSNSWAAIHVAPSSGEAPEGLLAPDSAYRQLQKGHRPIDANPEYWLRLEADLARWDGWLHKLASPDLPKIDFTVTGRKEYVRSQARLTFREPIRSKVEKWEIPSSIIRDPLISFTAIQGFKPWLERQPWMKELGWKSVPDQLYLWGLSQTAFQIQAAVPVSDGSKAFASVSEKWLPKWNQVLATNAVGQMRLLTNRTELAWRGLPIIVPYLTPAHDNNHDYLRAGIFPVNAPSNPPPAALFEQLTGTPNLLYFDWEITQARLDQLRPLLQLGAVFLTVSPMATNSSAYKWLDAVQPRLGNAATEVALVSPKELNVIRTSHLGFNGAELLALANWFEGTNFPQLNLDLNFRPAAHSKAQGARK
jgi:hypothetical protein